jgi:hypothetical protein
MSWIEAVPAYGRDYKNQKDVRADWNSGKDFQDAATRQYLNKQDAENLGLNVVIRYDNYRKVVGV